MATSLNNPKVTKLAHSDICIAIKEAIIKKNPELADEEFEVEFSYDSYNRTTAAVIQTL